MLTLYILHSARKAQVMTVNTEAANAYGAELGKMADQLRHDVSTLQKVQSNFGKTLQTELEAFAERGAKVRGGAQGRVCGITADHASPPQTLEQDKLFLDEQLSVFAESITALQSEIEGSYKRSISGNEEAQAAREQIEQSLTTWMSSTRTEAEQMARNLIEVHRDQMGHVRAPNAVETAPMPDCR
jgi:hypothetical protein